ncbi:hypothetical protein AcW1_000994 [Taiwanofungus camphoratus]|nr:hypothetical protein AcW1_000994 [Antrodia cinnamomea]
MSFSDELLRALFLTWRILHTTLLAFVSYILHTPIAGHSLHIGRISPFTFSIHDIRYSGVLYGGTYTYNFAFCHLSVRFHLPSRIYPRWFSLSAHELFYTSTTCDISVATLDTTFWVFPHLFARSAGPWVDVVLDGFRIRVHRSSATPLYVHKLRQNLISALLKGEILRVDSFRTSAHFAGISEPWTNGDGAKHAAEYPDSDSDKSCESDDERVDPAKHADRPPSFLSQDRDEIRVSALARGLHIHNTEGRMYTFARIDAQLRRDWNTNRGSFVVVAEEGRWIRVHWPYQREATGWWSQLVTSIVQFPFDVVHVVNYPMSTVNLYVPRTDVTFDQFRIRDAELLIQGLSTIREKTFAAGVHWGDVFFDAFIQAFITPS